MENAITIVSNNYTSTGSIPMSNLHKNKVYLTVKVNGHILVKVNGHIAVKKRPLMKILTSQMRITLLLRKKNKLNRVTHHMSHLSQKKNT
jgi:hypothetical protein